MFLLKFLTCFGSKNVVVFSQDPEGPEWFLGCSGARLAGPRAVAVCLLEDFLLLGPWGLKGDPWRCQGSPNGPRERPEGVPGSSKSIDSCCIFSSIATAHITC